MLNAAREAMKKAGLAASDIAAIGIANQRETTVIWDRLSGKPIHNAIVWQDRRTADLCAGLRNAGHEPDIAKKTGLLLDPYFSATKIAWLLDHVEGARTAAQAGRLAFGTIDSYLLWRLTGGKVHLTDATNAARARFLFNIRRGRGMKAWRKFSACRCRYAAGPRLRGRFWRHWPDIFGGPIRILGIAGDQQAATIGQGCFQPGMMKSTYGTGCFALLNTGDAPVTSNNRLPTTIAYQLAGKRTYALEGAIFIAGAAVQWLRDSLKVISQASDADALALRADPAEEVYLVPAFVGLGAPYWDASARGAMFGLSRKSGAAEFARAALESVGYQTRDLLDAMRADWPGAAEAGTVLRVDGGMSASNFTMQFLADILDAAIDRPVIMETTALGAAYLAGFEAGLCPAPETFAKTWRLEHRFEPRMAPAMRERKWAGWRNAMARTLTRN